VAKLDEENWMISKVLQVMGLTHVRDTFVGGQAVRGVSGGERRRVTVSEMLALGVPCLCCDEISTGLDAATTFDICRMLGFSTRMIKSIKIMSLLQPPPETVALFDELILLSEGLVIFAGPIDKVEEYFEDLGYVIPERMDVSHNRAR